MKRMLASAIAVSFLLTACGNDSQESVNKNEESSDEKQNDSNKQQSDSDEKKSNDEESKGMETVVDGLNTPWSIEKMDNTFYLTERLGKIVKIEGNQRTEDRKSVV